MVCLENFINEEPENCNITSTDFSSLFAFNEKPQNILEICLFMYEMVEMCLLRDEANEKGKKSLE